MNTNLSEAMKKLWESKSQIEMDNINSKRGDTLKNSCVYMRADHYRSYPCKKEMVLDKLAIGHLIVSTPKNRDKVKSFLGEVPEIFFTK